MSGSPRILIADDQRDVREALRLMLKSEGFETGTAASPQEILTAVSASEWDAVLMDLNYTRDTTSGREGLDLLARLHALDETLPIVVMTAWASVGLAVETMRHGARDFVEKPWDNARLLNILRTQVDLGRALRRGERLEAENRLLRGEGERDDRERSRVLARSPAMRPVLDLIERVGPSEANILITGENGTGKGVVARALHAVSPRAGKPMVTVNTGGLSESVFESELFGHVRGAFTDAKTDRAGRFELADSGILFLDEIANISLGQQTKLLRVLETGEFERVGSSRTRSVDVRVFSATNSDLREEVKAGRFRQDLLFRLNTVEIHIPPLRARVEDIPLLAEHFAAKHGRPEEGAAISPPARDLLVAYDWPGNVRELENVIARALALNPSGVVTPEDLPEHVRGARPAAASLAVVAGAAQERPTLAELERRYAAQVLQETGGNKTRAAEILGIDRKTLYRLLGDGEKDER